MRNFEAPWDCGRTIQSDYVLCAGLDDSKIYGKGAVFVPSKGFAVSAWGLMGLGLNIGREMSGPSTKFEIIK